MVCVAHGSAADSVDWDVFLEEMTQEAESGVAVESRKETTDRMGKTDGKVEEDQTRTPEPHV